MADAFDDEFGGVAEVGEEADAAVEVMEDVADGVVGVVGDGEGFDGEVSEGEGLPGFKEFPSGVAGEFRTEVFHGGPVAVDGDAVAAGEDVKAGDVVAVFVGDEDGVEVAQGPPEGEEAVFDLFAAEAGVDEDADGVGFEVGAVAATAAGEDGEPEHDLRCSD